MHWMLGAMVAAVEMSRNEIIDVRLIASHPLSPRCFVQVHVIKGRLQSLVDLVVARKGQPMRLAMVRRRSCGWMLT